MPSKQFDHIPLTASEITDLWSTFQYETLAICGIEIFLTHIDDEQIRLLLEERLSSSKERKEKVIGFFKHEDYPIPQGFTEQEVNFNAPRLFSDRLYLEYILKTTKLEITQYGTALMKAIRADTIEFFSNTLIKSQQLHIKAKELAKEKGLIIRAPMIPKPKQIDFVKKESFLSGWLGEQRPLTGMEISHLVFNAKRNALGQAVITGFSQVAKSKSVRRYFEKGRDISGDHLRVFSKTLYDDYLTEAALLLTSEVTDSKKSPFSDKLMMTFITMLIGSGIGQYGTALSMSPRHDLGILYTQLIAQIAKYSNEGANILIDHGWMEQPPMAIDRKDLAK